MNPCRRKAATEMIRDDESDRDEEIVRLNAEERDQLDGVNPQGQAPGATFDESPHFGDFVENVIVAVGVKS